MKPLKSILLAAAMIMISAMMAAQSRASLTVDEARELAKDAWLFGLPLVMFEKQFDYGTYTTKPDGIRAPVNQFVHYRRFLDASNRTVVGFNVDNLYSFANLDLAPEPIVLSIPKMGDRFWLIVHSAPPR